MWETAGQIGTGISLVAFIVAAIVAIFRNQSGKTKALIKTAPESERPALVRDALQHFHVNTENLTKTQQYEIALLQIDNRNSRFNTAIRGAIAGGVLVALLSVFAIYSSKRPQTERKIKPLNTVSGVIIDPCDKKPSISKFSALFQDKPTLIYLDELIIKTGCSKRLVNDVFYPSENTEIYTIGHFPENSLKVKPFCTSDTTIDISIERPQSEHNYSSMRGNDGLHFVSNVPFIVQAGSNEGFPWITLNPNVA